MTELDVTRAVHEIWEREGFANVTAIASRLKSIVAEVRDPITRAIGAGHLIEKKHRRSAGTQTAYHVTSKGQEALLSANRTLA